MSGSHRSIGCLFFIVFYSCWGFCRWHISKIDFTLLWYPCEREYLCKLMTKVATCIDPFKQSTSQYFWKFLSLSLPHLKTDAIFCHLNTSSVCMYVLIKLNQWLPILRKPMYHSHWMKPFWAKAEASVVTVMSFIGSLLR